jgi:hypothetical protein
MAYGLEQRPFVENGPAITAAKVQPERAAAVYRAWRKLSADSRLAIVERKLSASADLSDGLPLAL